MRVLGFLSVVSCFLATACASSPPPVPRTLEEERRMNEDAYRSVYLPQRGDLVVQAKGGWLSVVDGHVLPSDGKRITPATTMEEAVAAAGLAAPRAKHRFVFAVGEEGDVEWAMGGCELKHVVGIQFIALIEPVGVSGPDVDLKGLFGEQFRGLLVKGPDSRLFLRPAVGPPCGSGTAGEIYCVSTGFGGFATMTPETARGLELWEIPGSVMVYPVHHPRCRRARARFAWPGSKVDFTVPVAIWPD